MSRELRPYSGPAAGCPKCGTAKASTAFNVGSMTGKKNPKRAEWICGRLGWPTGQSTCAAFA
jgi:hypothetical protein